MVSGVVRRAALNCALFPLTPALSLGERANCRQAVREPSTVRRVKALERIPPLPEGEGRGEGEGDARSTHPILIGPGVRSPPEGFRGSEPFINSSLRLCQRSLTLFIFVFLVLALVVGFPSDCDRRNRDDSFADDFHFRFKLDPAGSSGPLLDDFD